MFGIQTVLSAAEEFCEISVLASMLALYKGLPLSPCVFIWSSVCACLCLNTFLEGHQPCWIGAHLSNLIFPNYLFKDPFFKCTHILRYRGLGLPCVNEGGCKFGPKQG